MTDQVSKPYSFEATRESGLKRLSAFLPYAGKDYAAGRNYDHGSFEANSVSALSPYLSRRLITEQEVVSKVLDTHSLNNAEPFVKEVCWRTYWKGWLEMRPQIWRFYLQGVEDQEHRLNEDSSLKRVYENALAGNTPLLSFNHWVKELVELGYLHNHARMWFAGIWIYDLGLPWELGASFFASHLVDGDPASNTLSWRWVAGLHTQGKRYIPSAGNISKFTAGRFNEEGCLHADNTGPRFEELPAPTALSFAPRPQDRDILFLSRDDLALDLPEAWGDGLKKIVIGSASESSYPCGWKPSEKVYGFDNEALADAVSRWRSRAPVDVLEGDDVAKWLSQVSMDRVAMPRLPVGPGSDSLQQVFKDLGAKPQVWTREWDRQLWPHAKAGFFGFWKKVNPLFTGGRVDIPA